MYYILFLVSVFISSVSQILLKKSANRRYDNKIQEYMNLRVIVAYGIFFISSLMTVLAYRFVPLSMGGILESSGYIFITVLGYIFLNEKVNQKKIIGLFVILVGIVIFNI